MTPEKAKITRKEYEEEMRKLQIELCKLQEWVKHAGLRIIVIFEGRDAAGKECLLSRRKIRSACECHFASPGCSSPMPRP